MHFTPHNFTTFSTLQSVEGLNQVIFSRNLLNAEASIEIIFIECCVNYFLMGLDLI